MVVVAAAYSLHNTAETVIALLGIHCAYRYGAVVVASKILNVTDDEANCEASAGAPSDRIKVFAEPFVADAPTVAVGFAPVEVE